MNEHLEIGIGAVPAYFKDTSLSVHVGSSTSFGSCESLEFRGILSLLLSLWVCLHYATLAICGSSGLGYSRGGQYLCRGYSKTVYITLESEAIQRLAVPRWRATHTKGCPSIIDPQQGTPPCVLCVVFEQTQEQTNIHHSVMHRLATFCSCAQLIGPTLLPSCFLGRNQARCGGNV